MGEFPSSTMSDFGDDIEIAPYEGEVDEDEGPVGDAPYGDDIEIAPYEGEVEDDEGPVGDGPVIDDSEEEEEDEEGEEEGEDGELKPRRKRKQRLLQHGRKLLQEHLLLLHQKHTMFLLKPGPRNQPVLEFGKLMKKKNTMNKTKESQNMI